MRSGLRSALCAGKSVHSSSHVCHRWCRKSEATLATTSMLFLRFRLGDGDYPSPARSRIMVLGQFPSQPEQPSRGTRLAPLTLTGTTAASCTSQIVGTTHWLPSTCRSTKATALTFRNNELRLIVFCRVEIFQG